ncbi:MAG: hypothetical protein ACRCXT_12950, partial [Paraclostridium sp.]
MAKFMNTSYKKTVDDLADGFKEKLSNPYYIFTDKQPFKTIYYNRNLKKSTLDQGSKLEYSSIGKNSPTKYNKIQDFYLYGLERIMTQLELGDFGLESSSIEGEAIILPNTIIPVPDDYFIISHMNKPVLFKVTNVSVNTIENGSNFYKIEYKLDKVDNIGEINNQVDSTFEMIINNVGTQFNSIIRSSEADCIRKIEVITDRLKTYYCNLFYNNRVQTFTVNHNGFLIYDPYLIEFIKCNELVRNNDNYIHVDHQTFIPNSFALRYDKTIFKMVEDCVIK